MSNLEQVNMIEKVKEEFQAACLKCKRPEVFNLVNEKLNCVDSEGDCLLNRILSRAKQENSADLSSLVEKNFAIPLGLRAILTKIIMKHQHSHSKISVTSQRNNEIKNLEVGLSFWSQWKDGQMGQSQFFSSMNAAVVSGDLNLTSAKNLTNLMLQTSGYENNTKNTLSSFIRRIVHEASGCDLHQVSRIFPSGGLTSVHAYDGRSILLDDSLSTQDKSFGSVPDFSTSRSTPCASSDLLCWEHVGGPSGQLLLRPAVASGGGNTFQSAQSNCLSRQVLHIGDCIRLSQGALEVDEVICADILMGGVVPAVGVGQSGAVQESLNREVQNIILLVEGRMMNGISSIGVDASISGAHAALDRFCEGASELGGRDDVSHSSEGSGGEGNHNVIQLAVLHKRYFCVFAVAFRGAVTVQHVVAIHDHISPDQIPTRVLYCEPRMAVVSGSNGLLGAACLVSGESNGAVAANKDEVASSYTDLEKEQDSSSSRASGSPDRKKGRMVQSTSQYAPQFHLFTEDSLIVDAPVTMLTHAADATVSDTSYSTTSQRLVSGDAAGVVCVWRIDIDTGRGKLVAGPLQLSRNKVCSVSISPSGAHAAVALWDRLLLLAIQPHENQLLPQPSTASVSQQRSLIVRCTLDVIRDIPAKYAVAFGKDQADLRVWRVTRAFTAESAAHCANKVCITTWQHPNLDSFDRRFIVDPADVLASSTRTTRAFTAFAQQYKRGGSTNNLDSAQIFSLEDDPFFAHCDSERCDNNSVRAIEGMRSAAQSCASMMTDCEGGWATSDVEDDSTLTRTYVKIDGEYIPVHHQTAYLNLEALTAAGETESQRMDCDEVECEVEASGKTGKTSLDIDCSSKCLDAGVTLVNCLSPILPGDKNSAGEDLARLLRPMRGARIHENAARFTTQFVEIFQHDCSEKYQRVRHFFAVFCACLQAPTVGLLAAALELSVDEVVALVAADLSAIVSVSEGAGDKNIVTLNPASIGLNTWLCSNDYHRIGRDFWVDMSFGHNRLCALYLRHCGNKSVAVEHPWQDYLRTYGPSHLRRSSRGLRQLTAHIRKIDETANIKHNLPHQIGYIAGLQEIYARRVGLGGRIPKELGQLSQLRVLSMGNNHLYGELPAALGELKNLQRIVLHQNNLQGVVPSSLGQLGCIVNLAGNPRLQHGQDVPLFEKEALMDLFTATKGSRWSTKTHWCSAQHVAKWYKVGVLTSHVHSIVMSSNGMEGRLPPSINRLSHLRMIELATMPGLVGVIPKELCSLTTLRRLCICRCGLTGRIPSEIGQLLALEELQLFGNQLSGAIPSSISLLTNLKLLSFGEYTGGNSFAPAPLPSCLSTLVNLEALFMANCNLKGGLPDWIGNLRELRQLDLQRNNLTGSIPRSVGQLDNLLYLNIKDNEALSGKLPLAELMSLTKLNRLSLVHCNFQDAEADVETLKTALPRCKIWI